MNQPSAVILWWDAAFRLLTPDGKLVSYTVEPEGDHVTAIKYLMASECGDATSLRLIYHPAHLDSHFTTCPDTTRAKLHAVFAHEHPALGLPDTIWSVEPVCTHRDGDGSSTILYLDHRSRLPGLIDALAHVGIQVEGAWPLQTLIEATPPCVAAKQGWISVVAIGRRSLVSCGRPNGGRFLRFQDQPAPKLGADLNAALAFFDGLPLPPGLFVCDEGAPETVFTDTLRDLPFTETPLAEFLAHARILKPGSFSDFTPRHPQIALKTVLPNAAAVAGIALMLWAAHFAYSAHSSAQAARKSVARVATDQAQLAALVASRRAFKEQIDQFSGEIDRLRSTPPPHHELLVTLTKAVPKTMHLQSLTMDARSFTITGRIFEGAGTAVSPLAALRGALSVEREPWRLAESLPGASEENFSLHGSLTMPR